jgi:hypothetical protein
MTSRRRFLHASVAVAASGAIGGLGTTLGSPRAKPTASSGRLLQLHAVVVDQRFAESVEFGRELALRGAHIYSMRGDVTDVWYSRLYPLWKGGGVAVAGLTGNGVLFCLERLAWDHTLRVVYRGSHQRIAQERLPHANGNPSWPAALAASIAALESPRPAVPMGHALHPVCSTASRGLGRTDSPLFSWVIAPPARA